VLSGPAPTTRFRALPGEGRQRGLLIAIAVVLAAVLLLAATVATGGHVRQIAPVLLLAVTAVVASRRLLAWHSLTAALILVVLLVPVKRYTLPSSLPFHLEPYRLVVALIAVAWFTSLLIDPRVRFRATPIDKPLLLFLIAVLGSLIANAHRVGSLEAEVMKRLAFFVSYFVVVYFMVSILRRREHVDFVVKVIVWGGAVVSFFALIEARTNYNVFDHLASWIPILHLGAIPRLQGRGARLRVYASAQHPIALGAALVMLLPLTVYLVKRTAQRRYWLAAVLMLLAALSTVSRTAVVMLLVIGFVYLWLRPIETRRLWPLIVPLLAVVHVALPGTIGAFRGAFFPKGGLIAEQTDQNVGSGRLATLGPALHTEFRPHPLLGEGFGTRVTQPDEVVTVPNAPILDDQWLGTLLETGLIGTSLFIWLFVRFIRRAGREAKNDDTPRGWLLTATTAGVAAYGVGMFTYDAFAFIQVTFFLFFFLGLGCAALRLRPDPVAPTTG
jgi:polysaccharide biosynthesis protein PslJ